MTPERFKEADFIFPWSRGPFIAVIPYPKTVSNVKWGAIIEPWSTPVRFHFNLQENINSILLRLILGMDCSFVGRSIDYWKLLWGGLLHRKVR